ncbi:hypothetical protein N2152v2_007420 [Parachlorella kessleri]
MEALKAELTAAGQEHLLEGWEELSSEEQQALKEQLEAVDYKYLTHIYKSSIAASADSAAAPAQPVEGVVTLKASRVDGCPVEQRQKWRQAGLHLIAAGKLAVLLLAGGQGTRLGSALPKGCYNIGLPSRKSLFQLQAERLLRLQQLAAELVDGQGAAVKHPIRWYLMTSAATDAETKKHFRENSYFGLKPSQIVFFQQGMLPALTEDGTIIMESRCKLAMAPDGNGGVYVALRKAGVLEDMEAHGIECIDCYSVDNALVRLGDPVFAGFCHERDVDTGARVLVKAYPEEKVGVFARRNGALEVVEYSELDPADACAVDPASGELKFGWSNVCLHYFKRSWLADVSDRLAAEGKYHIAHKKIPSKDGPVQGIKLELFIFDTFPLAASTALLEVRREEEFAPVKNAPGSATDSPDTARAAIMALHKSWVEAAGGSVECPEGVEVSPLVSYAGEGLEGLCSGKTFREQFSVHLQGFLAPAIRGAKEEGAFHSPRPTAGPAKNTAASTAGIHLLARTGAA